MPNYKITKTLVGPWPRDRVITEQDVKAQGGDVKRLVRLGALAETNEDVTEEPLPYGPHNETVPPDRNEGDDAPKGSDISTTPVVPPGPTTPGAAPAKATPAPAPAPAATKSVGPAPK